MRRAAGLLAAFLLAAMPAAAQVNGWDELANGWGEIQTPTGTYATMTPPASATLGCVGVFLGSPLNLQCDTGLVTSGTGAALVVRLGTNTYLSSGFAGNLQVGTGPSGANLYNGSITTGNVYSLGALNGVNVLISAGGRIAFESGTGNDVGLMRAAPGTLKIADGGTGEGWALVAGVSTAIVDATPTAFATFTIADGYAYSGEAIYSVRAVKGTAQQKLKGRVQFAATREGSTYTSSVSEMGSQTLAAAAGTLTGAISISCAAGVCTLSANFDTSQSSPDSFTIRHGYVSTDVGLVVTPLP